MQSFLVCCLKAAMAVIAYAPRRIRHAIGDLIGILWFDILRIRRDVVLANIGLAFPGWSESERLKVGRASMRNLGRTITDYFLFPFFNDRWAKSEFDVQGMENFTQAFADHKGVLLFGMHMGSGDLAIAAFSRLGYPIHLISKLIANPFLNKFWFDIRKRHGTRLIAPEKSSFEILRALKRNEAVIFVLDQYIGPPVGVKTLFFGRETGTAAGLALMAERTGSPILQTYTFRQASGRSVIVFEKPLHFRNTGSREQNIREITQACTEQIERAVRLHPEQWMWVHKRWKNFGKEEHH